MTFTPRRMTSSADAIHTRPFRATRIASVLTAGILTAAGAAGVLTAGAAGCKPAVDIAEPSPFDEDDLRAQPDRGSGQHIERDSDAADGDSSYGNAGGRERLDARGPTTRRSRGLRQTTIARSDLHAMLERGPGGFLRGVELSAQFRDGRFSGWRIVQFMPGEMRFDPYDLQPGDIIGPINGRLIERPPHLATLWDELRTASAVVVEVRRDGSRFELHFNVSDSEAASTGTAP